MAGISKGIAGLGALFYVAYRVWQSLSRAEPVDIFPLLRPFAIGLCIMFFPTIVLGTINSVMSPVVQGTNGMLKSETFDMQAYAVQKDKLEYEAMRRNPETAYLVDNEIWDAKLEKLGITDVGTKAGLYIERTAYKLKKWIREAFRELLELIFKAAALVIDVIRTFFLIVLSILGPLAFALSVWDGFQSTLTQWISRYISVYLWLPVSDLFSTIVARLQSLMLQADIERMQDDPNFSLDGSDAVYIVFLIIAIMGYFTIPTVAGWIISAGGSAGGGFSRVINSTAVKGGAIAGGLAGAAGGYAVGKAMQGGGYIGGRLLQGTKSLIRGSKNKNDNRNDDPGNG
jgi:conjugative transposon TraJ protein